MIFPLNSKKVPCPVCGGRGIIPTPRGDRWQLCPRCDGRGWVTIQPEPRPRPIWLEIAEKVKGRRW